MSQTGITSNIEVEVSLLELECKGVSAMDSKAVFHIHVRVTIFNLGCKVRKACYSAKDSRAKADYTVVKTFFSPFLKRVVHIWVWSLCSGAVANICHENILSTNFRWFVFLKNALQLVSVDERVLPNQLGQTIQRS